MADGDTDHDKLIRVEEGVAYIKEKIDSICDQQNELDARVSKVENSQSRFAGGVSALAAGIAIVTSYIVSLFRS